MTLRASALLSAILLCSTWAAADSLYDCEVRHAYSVSADGTLEPYWLEKNYRGKRFSVSKGTGVIRGQIFLTDPAQRTRVIHPGNEHAPFQAAAESLYQLQLLTVSDSSSIVQKTFIAQPLNDIAVVTGVCDQRP